MDELTIIGITSFDDGLIAEIMSKCADEDNAIDERLCLVNEAESVGLI